MGEHAHQDLTIVAPETVVRERVEFVVRDILQFSFPILHQDALLWRNADGLHQVELNANQEITIGREEHCTVMLADDFTSRTHAKLLKKDEEWMVFDQQSKNGTWLNNHPIDAACLHSGDILRIGNTYLVYMEAPSPDPHASGSEEW